MSWIIVSKETGKAVFETFNQATAEKINTEKYTVMTALDYLVSVNGKAKTMNNTDRYLKIVEWARRRYSKNGETLISKGHAPSRYKMIEDLAGEKYVGFVRHYPNHSLKTAVTQ